MADAFQLGYTRQYLQEWGQTLRDDQWLSVPTTDQPQHLLRAEALEEPYIFDASQLAGHPSRPDCGLHGKPEGLHEG